MDNRQIIQQGYEAFSRGDIPAVLSIMADDITFTIPGHPSIPTARTWRGGKGMQEFFSTLGQEVEFTEFNPREYISEGDRVIVIGSYAGRVKRNGNPFRSDWVMAWRLKNGKAIDFQEFNDTLGLAESYGLITRAASA